MLSRIMRDREYLEKVVKKDPQAWPGRPVAVRPQRPPAQHQGPEGRPRRVGRRQRVQVRGQHLDPPARLQDTAR
jgi:hypothetical protein